MKKTFQLAQEGKNPDRLLEAIKHEVRKYIKRERRRALPEGVDFWDFDCQFGPAQESAAMVHLSQIIPAMDAVVQSGGTQFYVEILAKHGHRTARPNSGESTHRKSDQDNDE
jgi:Family of unknown function (DUF6172)